MSNMSYCRFRNTLQDLRDCGYALDIREGGLSKNELEAAISLRNLCEEIAGAITEEEIKQLGEACDE